MTDLAWNRGILGPMTARAEAPATGDAALVERARAGDRDAFCRLVERHTPRVWRVVYRIVRRREDAEDVVQEVFVAAYRALDRFRGEARFSTWLHRIAVTRALNHVQSAASRLERASVPLEPRPDDSDPGPAPEPRADGPSPLERLEAGELRRRLARCLEKLPAAWRAVLALREGEGLHYGEISRTLGLALGTVRSRLARARLALRRCLEEAIP